MKLIFTIILFWGMQFSILIAQPCTDIEELFRKRHWVGGTYGHPYTMFDRHNGKTFDSTIKEIRKRIIIEYDQFAPGAVCAAYQNVYNNAMASMPSDNGMNAIEVSKLAFWPRTMHLCF